jgi:hypothetical protein
MGIPGVPMPADPIQSQPTYSGALAAFQKLPPIRVLFDNGAGGSSPGQPLPAFEQSFSRFPIPGTKGRSWYLSTKGRLAAKRRGGAHANSFKWNAHATSLTDFSGDTGSGTNGLWTATPPYHWKQNPAGTAVSYVTKPLATNTTAIGAGKLTLWVRSSKPNVDLQATVSEVRPDGKETFVQGGWLRGADRHEFTCKDRLCSDLRLRKTHSQPLPRHRFTKLVIPLYFEGHVYRAGSRIRVLVSAPNGDQPIWSFSETKPKGKAKVAIGFGKRMRSKLTLPIVRGVKVPTGLPPCPGLRGEPCRTYKPLKDRVAKP